MGKRGTSVKRSHHRKGLSHLLLVCEKADMGFGSYPYVAMEVAAGDFDVLFNIVQAQIAERDGGPSRAASPKRKMRRRESD